MIYKKGDHILVIDSQSMFYSKVGTILDLYWAIAYNVYFIKFDKINKQIALKEHKFILATKLTKVLYV